MSIEVSRSAIPGLAVIAYEGQEFRVQQDILTESWYASIAERAVRSFWKALAPNGDEDEWCAALGTEIEQALRGQT